MRGLTLRDPALLGGLTSFSPLDLSPALWLDAADTATITESGGAVSQWNDKSGNGYTFLQATAASQPKTGTRTQNGLNVIDFDGGDRLVGGSASDWLFFQDGTVYLIGMVLAADGTGVNRVAISNQSTANQAGFYYGHVFTSKFHLVQGSVGNSGEADQTGVYVMTLIADPTNGTTADRSSIFNNAGSALKNNATTGTSVTSPASIALTVGARNATLFWDGTIAEIVVATGSNANELNRQLLRDYLNAKWAIY